MFFYNLSTKTVIDCSIFETFINYIIDMGFETLVVAVNDFVWGLPLVILCLGTGIYFHSVQDFYKLDFLKR